MKGKLKKASDHPLAAEIRKAIGAEPGEEVQISTPRFTRPEGDPPPSCPPADRPAFEALADLPESALKEMGLRAWGRQHEHADGAESGPMLWLFPGEWYWAIPAGTRIVSITFTQETFLPGVTDNDIRFGCLSFGILRQ